MSISWHYTFGEGSASPLSKPQTQPESQPKPQPTARPKSFSFSQAAASEALVKFFHAKCVNQKLPNPVYLKSSRKQPDMKCEDMWNRLLWTPSQPCFLTLLWQYLQVQQFVQALNDMGVLRHDHPSKPVKPSAMIMEAFQCRCTRRTQEGTGVDQVGRLSSSDFQWIQCKDGDWSCLVLK